jgi:hypothetical protein
MLFVVAFLVFFNLTLHRVYALSNGLLKGVGLFAVKEGLSRQVQ